MASPALTSPSRGEEAIARNLAWEKPPPIEDLVRVIVVAVFNLGTDDVRKQMQR
jgi:hypothetical protein